MKRVLILSHTQSYSDFKIGSHHYANGLSKLGYEVHFSGIPETLLHKLLKKRKKEGTCKIDHAVFDSQIKCLLPLTLKKNKTITALNLLTFFLYDKNKKLKGLCFDVVVCDYPYFQTVLPLISFKKLIYRPTDDYVAMMGINAVKYEDEICKVSDLIVATSTVVSDKIKKRYLVDNKKIHVITNGYDESHFKRTNDSDFVRENAIYIGALDSRFDFDALKYLASNRSNIVFNIFGPKSKELNEREDDFALLSNVKFHGKIDYEETNTLMNQHKVGLLLLADTPSNKGRSPMKLWEYIASGLNVLYSNIDGVSVNECLLKYSNYEEMLKLFDEAYFKDNFQVGNILRDHSWSGKVKKMENLSFN